MRLVIMLFVFGVLKAHAGVPMAPSWSLASLNGVRSYHDGANCYNGALAARGYQDFLVHSSARELRFFLETFCARKRGSEKSGDVITILREGTLEHAALSIDQSRIFDKNSIAGFNGRFDDRAESSYRIKDRSESEYLTACQLPHCQVEVYSCPVASAVRTQMRTCFQRAEQVGIRSLQSLLQEVTLDAREQFSLDPGMWSLFKSISDLIGQMRGDEECGLYLLSSATSIYWHLWNLDEQRDLGADWNMGMENLRFNLAQLEDRILKFDSSSKTRRILMESSWM